MIVPRAAPTAERIARMSSSGASVVVPPMLEVVDDGLGVPAANVSRA
jgi:hypothetical protein